MIRNAVLVVVLGLAWGMNWPAVRLALDGFEPFTFRAIGFSCSTLLLFAVMALRGIRPVVPRAHWPRLALVGAFSVAAYNLFSALAQLSASTTRSAVLSYTMPVWTVLFARLVVGERFDRRRILGLLLGAAGLVALGEPILRAGQFTIGLVHAVLSGIVWAGGSVTLKRFPIAAPPLVITSWQLLLGALISTALALALEGVPVRVPDHAGAWAGLAYNVVIGQALATTLWFTILGRMPAGIAAIGSLLVPAVGVIGATLILGEHPTASDWLGLVLIVAAAATVLVRPSAAPSTVPSPPPAMVAPGRSAPSG